MTDQTLAKAAFGNDPGRWPLPAATGARDRWLRAVAAGGQGRYHSAVADLAALRREPSGPLVSLACSTHASFLRQLGWHGHARTWDGRALALAGADAEAGADGLIGLAADALGVGRFAASAMALRRAKDLVDGSPPRARVRLAWVSAELAMARGDGPTAVAHAEAASTAAAGLGSARHSLKSEVIHAAALCAAGDLAAARAVADPALEVAEKLGMIPLRWALACLLADIGSTGRSAVQIAAIRDAAAETVRERGGVWSVR